MHMVRHDDKAVEVILGKFPVANCFDHHAGDLRFTKV